MKEKILAILILFSLLFIGCANTKNVPLADSCADDLKNHTVTCAEREAPEFMVETYGKRMGRNMGGLIGALIVASVDHDLQTSKIISENGVEDPADYIAQQLMSGLTAKYQLNQVNAKSSTLDSDDVKNISSLYKVADYVLDVKTVNWGTGPWQEGVGTKGPRYKVAYGSKLRLINTNEKTIVAEGFCNFGIKHDGRRYEYEELIENNAKALKNDLKEKADYCVDYFRNDILRLQ